METPRRRAEWKLVQERRQARMLAIQRAKYAQYLLREERRSERRRAEKKRVVIIEDS